MSGLRRANTRETPSFKDVAPARTQLMKRVRQRDTTPELALRRALFALGLRFRVRSTRKLPGRPDIFFPRARLAVFVDGCFWHCCPVHASWPRNNASVWAAKLRRNVERDRAIDSALHALSWKAIHVWEHEVKADSSRVARRISGIVRRRSARKAQRG
jgi:DNA mismatch endonuclease, patch repair protein